MIPILHWLYKCKMIINFQLEHLLQINYHDDFQLSISL